MSSSIDMGFSFVPCPYEISYGRNGVKDGNGFDGGNGFEEIDGNEASMV